MANPSKDKGTRAESALVAWSVMAGVPAIRPALAGTKDHGDVWLWPSGTGAQVIVEVKDQPSAFSRFPSGTLLQDWWQQTEAEALVAECSAGVLVVKPKGVGYNRVGDWWAWAHPHDVAWIAGRTVDPLVPVPAMWPYGSLLAWLKTNNYAERLAAMQQEADDYYRERGAR